MASWAGWSSMPSCRWLGHLEAPGLESLVPDGQPVAVKVKELDAIPATVEKEEEMAGQEVLCEALLNQPGKAIKTFTHIGWSCAKEHAHGRGELREHQSPPRPPPPSRPAAWMAIRSNSGLTAPVIRTTQALDRAISRCPVGPASRIDTGRKVALGGPVSEGRGRRRGFLRTAWGRLGRLPEAVLPGVERHRADAESAAELGDREVALLLCLDLARATIPAARGDLVGGPI